MNQKQIDEKSEEFIRMVRLYIIGFTDAKMVKNTLNCLFVDIMLDEVTRKIKDRTNLELKRRDFEQLLKEMVN